MGRGIISFDEAIALIRQITPLAGEERVTLDQACGRVLAQPVIAALSSPRQDVSAMDGYAVREADMAGLGTRLKLTGESFAGAGFSGVLNAGETVRIFTGAPVPQGADRVIMQENIRREGAEAILIDSYGPATHIRKAGNDFIAGDVLLPAGQRLSSRDILAAAAADYDYIIAAPIPRVAIIGTGDELAPPGTARNRPDAIPESVTYAVAASIALWGGDVVSRICSGDSLPVLEGFASAALAQADLVVVTGGASVGDKDFAKPMFAPHGLELLFEKVAIKPGKPAWLGRAGGKLVLGLPGNPTSAMVTARLFLKLLLAQLQRQNSPASLRWRRMQLQSGIASTGDRETFVRATWQDEGLMPVSNQDSGAQRAAAEADWLIRCPAGQPALAAGEFFSALEF